MWWRIVISSHGTAGDFVPLVPLGKALRQRGHSVVAAVNEAMRPLFERAGLDVAAAPRTSRAIIATFSLHAAAPICSSLFRPSMPHRW